MWNKLRPMLPHAAIVLANMFVVFFVVDQINPTMNFIDNGLTKGLLLVMSALAVANWWIARQRIRRAKARRAQKAAARKAGAAGRSAS